MSDARRAFAAHPLAALLATGLGAGLSPVAPGTAGSLLGLAVAWLLSSHGGILGSPVGLLMSGLAVGLLGVAVSGPVCRALSSEDPGCVVIDEVAGQMIACAGIPFVPGAPVWAWIAAFVLFRAFDIVKPLGIRRIQNLPGGWGVVADDVVGGIYAALFVALLGRWV
ncbi:MAG: phosphatidylglycerophosphatase A [Thermoanaerobaculia bacterium]